MDNNNNQALNSKKKIEPILIEDELKTSFLDYAMSVIVSRAIPDVRDGLKPVHRRVLYTMQTLGFYHNKPYHKSVRVVGEVLGKYHPHGDQAVYSTMVGMVQDFSKRYPLLDGQGNWGSIDGDNPAAMRYTEVRMEKIAQEILADLDKETVEFVPNFDESTVEPVILPSRLPNLLINGTSGIAVGMATSIPPHNLGEVIDACLAYLENENITEEELFALVPAPDFPTGGIICGRSGIIRAYKTGRGNLILRGVVEVEESKKKGTLLVITELPYMVNKADLAIKIAELVKEKQIEGIANIKDESNKKGIRLVLELKRGESPEIVLNKLYKYTSLQTSVSILMLALLDNKPIIFSLRDLIRQFVLHREEIVYRRTLYDLKKAQDREHILAGFIIALSNIDDVIALIKGSANTEEAISLLNKRYLLSEEQGKAILEMRLQRLTGLEQEKIRNEIEDLKKTISKLKSILEDKPTLKKEVIQELVAIKEQYADPRRTRIEGAIDILEEADLIPVEDVVVTITQKGYIKRVPLSVYGVQHRGGKGKMGMASLEEADDVIQDLYVAGTHDELLFFTNLGRVYSMRVFEVPEAGRTARGRAVINLIPLTEGEKVVKLLCLTKDTENKNIVMLTKKGLIKKTQASAFAKIRETGIRALTLKEDDELVFCGISSGENTIVIATAKGQGIHFKESEVRTMGRQAAGVMGIRLRKNDFVVGMEVITNPSLDLLFATENGYGKRVKIVDFRIAHRGGYGVRTIPTNERNGDVIGLAVVSDKSNILLIDQAGKIIRLPSEEIRTMGRQASGVRLIKLDEGQKLANMVSFDGEDEESENTANPSEIKSIKQNAESSNESNNNSDEELEIEDDSEEFFDDEDGVEEFSNEEDEELEEEINEE